MNTLRRGPFGGHIRRHEGLWLGTLQQVYGLTVSPMRLKRSVVAGCLWSQTVATAIAGSNVELPLA